MSSSATASAGASSSATCQGALTVEALEGRGRVTLPPQYVAEHVALGYALTVHKAQGSTVDRGIVLVDEQMTAQQLYVAMSRGREMNAALVVEQRCDPGVDVFWRSRRLTPVELLANVMRRDGAERSAHDVARENLAHMEDIGLLRHLLTEARRDLDERAGPDRNAEIVALAPRADVQRANEELTGAQSVPAARRGAPQEGRDRPRSGEHPPDPCAPSRSPRQRGSSGDRGSLAESKTRLRRGATNRAAVASRLRTSAPSPRGRRARRSPAQRGTHRTGASPVLPTRAPGHKALDRAARRARGRARRTNSPAPKPASVR